MNDNGWSVVPLARAISHRKEFVEIDDLESYKRCRVQLHAKGVVLRDIVLGAAIRTKKQQVCRSGEFLVAEIDAKVGGFGVVPQSLDGAIVSSHYFTFNVDQTLLDVRFLDWFARTPGFREQVAARGSTNYAAIRPEQVMGYTMPLPPLDEQRRIVGRIEEIAGKIGEARGLQWAAAAETHDLLLGAYHEAIQGADWQRMSEIAPLVRRPVSVQFDESYHELGIRSFGGGTFHKPAVTGADIGSKRIFSIERGDLLFSNVFAWEGAVAVASEADSGRVGSHRFISCVPRDGVATAPFLRFHFLTEKGLGDLGQASPGGAGRNRTLGLDALGRLLVPVPPYDAQTRFDGLHVKVDGLRRVREEVAAEVDALLPSVVERAFRGEL